MYDPFSLDSYDYVLPPELIAQTPIEPRDASRLLVIDRTRGTIEHHFFRNLPEFLDSKDLLVLNDTKVIRARLLGNRINVDSTGRETVGGKIEFLLLKPFEGERNTWEGAMASAARQTPGVLFSIPLAGGGALRGELIRGASESPTGTVVARFDQDPIKSGAGELPLPHYIERTPELADETRYNTVYAAVSGSAAAPTAGLHFTKDIFSSLDEKKIGRTQVTLHVGLGTFRPVKVQDVREHVMHEERYSISYDAAEKINAHRRSGGRILAVGTTSARTIESAWSTAVGGVKLGNGETRLFLRPDGEARFRVTDRLLTNFHLPKSTLLMLVCAFAGRELTLRAYAEAVERKYRFFSYGDAMLVL